MFRRGCCDSPLVLQQLCSRGRQRTSRDLVPSLSIRSPVLVGKSPLGGKGGFRAALLPVLSARLVWLGDSVTATVATKGVAAGLQ